nr:IS630 family transposase [Corallococcus sp. CA047B]
MDLRQRILEAYLAHEGTWAEIARRFPVGVATVDRLVGRWKRTHSLAPLRPGPRPHYRILDAQLAKVKRLLDAKPDSTTQEIADACAAATGVRVSRPTMGRAFRRLGYTRKKSLLASERRLAKSRQARRRYLDKASELKPSQLHFIDETAATLTMTRRYGRARRGQRTRGCVPMGRRQVLTMIGDLTRQGMGPMLIFEGATNSERFETYVREGLVPILKPHDVVILDNLSVHHRPAVEALIRSRGAHLLFLPPYSPDLNPIESCWLKVKTRLRAIGARTYTALIEAMRDALSTVRPQDAAAWFAYCGYPPQPP